MAAESSRSENFENIALLMHVPLHLTVELGSATVSVAEILKLGVGSIVELDRDVNHPVDLLVNRRAIARGEIVALQQNFALKITELIVL